MAQSFEALPDIRSAELTPEFWLQFVGSSEPGVRDKIVALAKIEIARTGPVDFNTKIVCDALDVKYPIINYYFGSRAGLMVAAVMSLNDEWIRLLKSVLTAKPTSAEKQLLAHVEADIAFAQRWGRMWIFGVYPVDSPDNYGAVQAEYGERMRINHEFWLAVLTQLIRDGRKKKDTAITFDELSVPRANLALSPGAFLAATSLAWSIHGLAAWTAGQHVGTKGLSEPSAPALTEQYVSKQHIKRILKAALAQD
jgi:AcrR family transcriptional regulator